MVFAGESCTLLYRVKGEFLVWHVLFNRDLCVYVGRASCMDMVSHKLYKEGGDLHHPQKGGDP